jgi:methyl-accepting chemotaxis protein
MFKNMKLGTKITLGFTCLILIAVTLGLLATWSMLGVKKTAVQLVDAQVPQIDVANKVERAALNTMFEARGYAYTEEKSFLDSAEEMNKDRAAMDAAATSTSRTVTRCTKPRKPGFSRTARR